VEKRKPAEDDLPDTIDGEPIDQWLSAGCFFYSFVEPDRTPDPEFVRLLMRFHERDHPWGRKLSGRELAAKVDFRAVQVPSLRHAIASVARSEAITQDAVKWEHREYGRPRVELDRERKAHRAKWAAADDSERIGKMLLRQTTPKRVGRPIKKPGVKTS
jgi:hypothetical protein